MNYGKAISAIRHLRGMTQIDLDKAVGVSESYICRIENNNRNLSLRLLNSIASKLNVNIQLISRIANIKKDADFMVEFSKAVVANDRGLL
jgi:transcriptional regulator with XRE-family HTH domain